MNIHTAITPRSAIYSTVETVTPELAESYLANFNTRNRNLRAAHVSKIASDISSGRWSMNGATVVFADDGTLLDGQHRMAAIAKAGIPVQLMIVRGVPSAAMNTIDCGVTRGAHDVAGLMGYAYAHRIVGAARLLIGLKSGQPGALKKTSNSEIIAFLGRNKELQACAADTDSTRDFLPTSIASAWLHLARRANPVKAEEALNVIRNGVPAFDGDPIHVFRERVIRMDSLEKNHASQRVYLLNTMIGAWNDFVIRSPWSICKIRKNPIKMVGMDYSSL